MSKYIFVTGGVISSLGKGIAASAIGVILQKSGINVNIQKIDPYLNFDSGTLSPYEHGECYVTEDGKETDLDLGNYERFLNIRTSGKNIVTGGSIYSDVIENERSGKYLGKTVQIVPHVTEHIKNKFKIFHNDRSNDNDVIIIEIGGTVGDIESAPFLEALRQFKLENARNNVLVLHLTWIPYIKTAKEFKTKPTQHSIKHLLSLGIQPDAIICRSEHKILCETKEKIAFFSNLNSDSVFELYDVDLVYKIPSILLAQNISQIFINKLAIPNFFSKNLMNCWNEQIYAFLNPLKEIKVAIIGKYNKVQDSYLSIKESLVLASIHCQVKCKIVFIDPERSIDENLKQLSEIDSILVAHGFGSRGIEGKINIVHYARTNSIPFLGICLGMHCAIVEYARNVLNIQYADSEEFNLDSSNYVVVKKSENFEHTTEFFNSSMFLGSKHIKIKKDSCAYGIYEQENIYERFRHKYSFNNKYLKIFESSGDLVFSGFRTSDQVASILEIKSHPFFLAVQFHVEFNSFFEKPHKIFIKFLLKSKNAF